MAMTPTGWIAVAAVLVLLLGLWLMLAGRGMRQRRGLGDGKTVSLDRITLTSHRLGMTGGPDRLIKTGGTIVVEEWKPPVRSGRGTKHKWGATSC
jgi:CRISPR-associated exonuclease Cas4